MPKRLREDSISQSFAVPETLLQDDTNESSTVHTPKYSQLDTPEPENPVIQCSLPPHQELTFTTYADFDAHYQREHTNRCIECGANLPSSHFLELHIAENHDALTATKRDQGVKTFACFVPDCEKVCVDWKRRRMHLEDKHGFPKNYDFLVVKHGVDGLKSLLRPGVDENGHRERSRNRNSERPMQSTNAQETSSDHVENVSHLEKSSNLEKMEVDNLTTSMSALKMVPRSVAFGRKTGRGIAKG